MIQTLLYDRSKENPGEYDVFRIGTANVIAVVDAKGLSTVGHSHLTSDELREVVYFIESLQD